MKLSCPFSGIQWNCNPGFGSAKLPHPTMHLSLDQLNKLHLAPFIAGKLNQTELHLYGTALVRNLPIKHWSAPLVSPAELESTWMQHIQSLVRITTRLDRRIIDHIPQFHVSKSNADLKNLKVYLDDIDRVIESFEYVRNEKMLKQTQDERTEDIAKILRTTEFKLRGRGRLPVLIAQWAAHAGNFPRTMITVVDGKKLSIRDYWMSLITTSFAHDSVTELLKLDGQVRADYAELLEHCEQQIAYSSLHTDILLEKLRAAIDILQEFRGEVEPVNLNDLFEVSESIEPVIIQQKPATKPPDRAQFKSAFEYMKAMMSWRTGVITYSNQQRKEIEL